MIKIVKRLMQQKNQERLVALGLLALLFILLIPLLIISKYNSLAVDDYTYLNIAQNGLREGQSVFGVLFTQMKNSYECWSTWQGQYFVNWLIMSFLVVFGPEKYYLVIVFTLIPLLLAELYLAYVVLVKGFGATGSQMLIVIVPIMIMHFSVPISLVEAYYWLSGAVTYTTTYAISLVSIALMVDLMISADAWKKRAIFVEVVLLLFSVCLGGSNFVPGLFMLLVFFLFAAYSLFVKHRHRIFYVINLLVFVACFLVTALSPGATNRRTENADAAVPAVKAIFLSLYEASKFVKAWSFPFVILLLLAMIPVFWKIIKKKNMRFPLPLLVLIISFGMYAAQFTPNQFALGIVGAYRVQNIYRYQMLFLLLGNEFYILGYLHRRFPNLKIPFADKICKFPFVTVIYGFLATCAVFLCMCHYAGSTLSSLSAYRDVRNGFAQQYYNEYLERVKMFEDDTIQDVVLKPFSYRPYALYFYDFQYSHTWTNEDAAEYYGKNTIILQR